MTDPDPTPRDVAEQVAALQAATEAARLDRLALSRARLELCRDVEFLRRLEAALVPFAKELIQVGVGAASVAAGVPPGAAALLTGAVGVVAEGALERALGPPKA